MTVLILARDIDTHVDDVVMELNKRAVPAFRTDLAAFPSSLSLTATLDADGWSGTLSNAHRSVDLREIDAVWYRHPSHFLISDRMSRPERRHAAAEARVGVAGVLAGLNARWMNHPARESAMFKPRQLDVARRCGMAVPATLVTNAPDAVTRFAADVVGGPLASKNLTGAAMVESGQLKTAFTRRLQPEDLTDLRGIDTTAHLFQQFIDKAHEVRLTCVGSQVFAAAIHAATDPARIDFRTDYDALTYAPIDPPPHILNGMRRFMAEFDITFGAFDFAVTHDGEWIMFECNPFGAYQWLEAAVGLPITAAIADVLTGKDQPE
ncbi:MAG: ATP-grasp ribosomal peptide maturase [Pseudonocardia sp.]